MNPSLWVPAAVCAVVCCPCLRDGAEQLSVDRALRALSRAEVVVMVVDGSDGVTQQVCTMHKEHGLHAWPSWPLSVMVCA